MFLGGRLTLRVVLPKLLAIPALFDAPAEDQQYHQQPSDRQELTDWHSVCSAICPKHFKQSFSICLDFLICGHPQLSASWDSPHYLLLPCSRGEKGWELLPGRLLLPHIPISEICPRASAIVSIFKSALQRLHELEQQ